MSEKGSVSLEEFFSNFSDQEEFAIGVFLGELIMEENRKRPDRKSKDSICLRILTYERALYFRNRFHANYKVNKTAGNFLKYHIDLEFHVNTHRELTTNNSLFHVKLFEIIGENGVREVTEKYSGKRLYFSMDSWKKLKRTEHILNDLLEGVPEYIIEKKYGLTNENIRQIKHRATLAGKLPKKKNNSTNNKKGM